MLYLDFLTSNILFLILILLTLNFIAIAVLRSEERFWLLQIFYWLFLFICFLIFNTYNKNELAQKQLVYAEQKQSAETEDHFESFAFSQEKKKNSEQNKTLIRLLGSQSFMCFLCLLLGYKLTGKKQFRSGAVSFFLLLMVYAAVEIIF